MQIKMKLGLKTELISSEDFWSPFVLYFDKLVSSSVFCVYEKFMSEFST